MGTLPTTAYPPAPHPISWSTGSRPGRQSGAHPYALQTRLLRSQLEAMPDGGVFAMTSPRRLSAARWPFTSEPAWSLVTFKAHKLRSKVIVPTPTYEIQSEESAFQPGLESHYKNIVDYRPNSELCLSTLELQRHARLLRTKADVAGRRFRRSAPRGHRDAGVP